MRRPRWLLSGLFLLSVLAAACSPAALDPTPTVTLTPLDDPATDVPPTQALDEPDSTATPLPLPGNVRPPAAVLTIAGQAQTSAIGTYCWTNLTDGSGVGLCVDMIGINSPNQPLAVPSGPFTAQFALPLDEPPTSTALYVMRANSDPTVYTDTQTFGWPFPSDDSQLSTPLTVSPTVDLALDDGLYVLALFAQWQGVGDVMYG